MKYLLQHLSKESRTERVIVKPKPKKKKKQKKNKPKNKGKNNKEKENMQILHEKL
jgi:hypothetical protein